MSSSLPTANVSVGNHVEVMELTAESLRERLKHEAMLLDLEAKKRAFAVDVPTLPHDVREALRNLGQPVRLFGENLANVRDRLRMELARRQVLEEQLGAAAAAATSTSTAKQQRKTADDDETKYTRASVELMVAREEISLFSLQRAQKRLDLERQRRQAAKRKRSQLTATTSGVRLMDPSTTDEDEYMTEITKIDEKCLKLYKNVRNLALEGSQYGDRRPLSALCTSLGDSDHTGHHKVAPLIVTGSWSGTVKVWDGSSPQMELRGTKTLAHDDRIMGIAVQELNDHTRMVATASIDLTAKLWKLQLSDQPMEDNDNNEPAESSGYVIQEVAHLKGHAARLSRVAFHPMKKHVVTTSFDHTWRLWDIESGQEILLQDGHWKETYGVGFHPDGSLCATTDFGSVVQVWDLRTGKSICHFLGHAKRVLCAEFSPNGFQLATAGDDGTIKIWDLRRRKPAASIPAHCNLISQLRFDRHRQGECLASASFDGTAKVWSTRDWKMLATLRGHEGKVVGVDWLREGIVTSGFDKTLKMWR